MTVTVRHWGKVRVHQIVVEGDYTTGEARTHAYPGADACFEPTAAWLERGTRRRELDVDKLLTRHSDLADDAALAANQQAAADHYEAVAWEAECRADAAAERALEAGR